MALTSGLRGVVIIHSRDATIDVVILVQSMLHDIRLSQRLQTRYSIRIEVMHRTCFARMNELMNIAQTVIDQHFNIHQYSSPPAYAIIFNKRGQNETMERMTVIEKVAAIVGQRGTVDLTSPHIVIIIQVATRMSAVGIVNQWKELCKYNIRVLADEVYGKSKDKDREKKSTEPVAEITHRPADREENSED